MMAVSICWDGGGLGENCSDLEENNELDALSENVTHPLIEACTDLPCENAKQIITNKLLALLESAQLASWV